MFDRFAEKLRERFKRQEKSESAPEAAPPAAGSAPTAQAVPASEATVEHAPPGTTASPPSAGTCAVPTPAAEPAASAPPEPAASAPPAVPAPPPEAPVPGGGPRGGLMQSLKKGWQFLNTDVTELGGGKVLGRLRDGLRKTREGFVHSVQDLFRGRKIDESFWESLEEILITADVGVNTSMRLVEDLRRVVKERRITEPSELTAVLKEDLRGMLAPVEAQLRLQEQGPTVIMVVGVNGAGKTTTIGKLAWQLKSQGLKVMLGAADTFRAAAIDQLAVWAQRCEVDMIRLAEGADPAAVAFDAVQAAKARGVDVLILDTAGRLHSKVNLMEELKKVRRVIQRQIEDAPHEVILVLDGTTGQNALQQARTFRECVDVTGLVLAKLDGTARGGIVIAIADELKIPVKFIGIGERVEDLRPFDAEQFVEALFGTEESEDEAEEA